MVSDRVDLPDSGQGADVVEEARRIAEEALWPAALDIDRAYVVPSAYLDLLANAGLYGLYAPVGVGGLDADPTTAARVVEALGGASLATTFVWLQHHSALRAVAASRPSMREHWLGALCSGRVRAGIAIAALRRKGTPALTAEPLDGGWVFDGTMPWVTGWDRIGVVYVGARHNDDIVWALVDAQSASTLRPRPLDLAAVRSSSTVALSFTGHPVPHRRVVSVEPYAEWRERDRLALQMNGYLSIGVAARCATILGSTALAAEVDEARLAMDLSGGDTVVRARAKATILAARAATMLLVRDGGASVDMDHHAQRLCREAMFLLVFGQTEEIKQAQLSMLLRGDG